MPARPWPLWCLTGAILIGYPILNFVYWSAVLRSGVLDPQADSIGIPIIGSVYLTLILSPVVLGVTWLCLRRYNPEARLASWRRDRPCRSALASLVLGAPAALVMVALTWDSLPGQPWQEYLWPAYATLLLAWLLGLRAAAIEQLGRNE